VSELCYRTGVLDASLEIWEAWGEVARKSGDLGSLQASLGNQAVIHHDRGELDEAMRLHKEEERICRELGNKDGLQASLGNQAMIHAARGELDEAMRLLKEQERICRELGRPEGVAISLANQAVLLAAELDRPREALPLAEEAYRIATGHGLTALAGQIKPILDSVRAKAR
jgi:tetratricopeptide (TPR) repeat protein